MNGRTMATGTMLLMLLGAGCANHADFAVSALVRSDEVRPEASRIKVDLSEILTP